MFKDAIEIIACDYKEWSSVSDEDRMYLYTQYADTKKGSVHIFECFNGEGSSIMLQNIFSLLLRDLDDDEVIEDLKISKFELLDEYLCDIMEQEFNSANDEMRIDMETAFLNDELI